MFGFLREFNPIIENLGIARLPRELHLVADSSVLRGTMMPECLEREWILIERLGKAASRRDGEVDKRIENR